MRETIQVSTAVESVGPWVQRMGDGVGGGAHDGEDEAEAARGGQRDAGFREEETLLPARNELQSRTLQL